MGLRQARRQRCDECEALVSQRVPVTTFIRFRARREWLCLDCYAKREAAHA